MVDLEDPAMLYDAGDVLRRDGACEQRGRFERDTGRYDAPGEVFSACAGAALYRRPAVAAPGGFDERFGTYLEDVELGASAAARGLALPLGAARVARHAGGGAGGGGGTARGRACGAQHAAAVARAFPCAVAAAAYRQVGWAGAGRLRRGPAGKPSPAERPPLFRYCRRFFCSVSGARCAAARDVPIEQVVPKRPFRGPRAGGHPGAGF